MCISLLAQGVKGLGSRETPLRMCGGQWKFSHELKGQLHDLLNLIVLSSEAALNDANITSS